MTTIHYTPRAERDLQRLDRPVAERILEALDRLAREGAGEVRPLTGRPGELRLRVGDWRVRFTRDREARTLTVLRVVHRSQAYYD